MAQGLKRICYMQIKSYFCKAKLIKLYLLFAVSSNRQVKRDIKPDPASSSRCAGPFLSLRYVIFISFLLFNLPHIHAVALPAHFLVIDSASHQVVEDRIVPVVNAQVVEH